MIRPEVRSQLEGFGFALNATAFNLYIDQAVREVWAARRWPFKQAAATTNAVVGQRDYAFTAFATDVQRVASVRLERGTEFETIDWLDPDDLRDNDHLDRDNAQPFYWSTFADNTVSLWPRPDATYTIKIDYLKALPALDDVTQLPGPPDHHDVYVYGALRMVALRERNNPSSAGIAGWAQGMYDRRFRSLASAEAPRGGSVVRSEFWGDAKPAPFIP